jgi:Tfp pilus assembly protein PilF
VRIAAADALAISPAMKQYLTEKVGGRSRFDDRRKRLIDALYRQGELKLEYDTRLTRNASQAFDARSGNCMSLVMMTGALARELGLAVRYQQVRVDESWERSGDMYFSIGHVNLTLSEAPHSASRGLAQIDEMLVDFQPPTRPERMRYRIIDEATLTAMYLNNRAAESLAAGQVVDAYWWVREAIRSAPQLLAAYNTLGVVYRKHGQPRLAEDVLRLVLARDPDSPRVLSNLIIALRDQGRAADADALAQRLARIEPDPPYSFFHRGMAALDAGDLTAARDLFAKEVDRSPYNHEFQFWLAATYARLGDLRRARSHLAEAIEYSPTRSERELYSDKLAKLRAVQAH